jgi:hypothetical protein
MTAKYLFLALAILVIAGLVFGAFYFGRENGGKDISAVERQIINQPAETRIIREHVPAVIETLYVNREAREIATYNAVIDTNQVSVDIGLRYDEASNLFDLIRFHAVPEKKNVIVSTTTNNKPKPFGLTGGVSVGFQKKEDGYGLASAGIDCGVVFAGKYSATAGIDTNGTLSVRLGVNF